jgi:carbonic anhydrase
VLLDAWGRGQAVTLHGWVYGVHDGLLKDLQINVDAQDGLEQLHRAAVDRVAGVPRS